MKKCRPITVSNPSNALALYVTLVGDAQSGLVDTTDGNSAVLTQLKQLDAPADKPANIDMPLGLISFVADVGTPGITETFGLFVDNSIPINGYFKKNAAGDWVNIATSIGNEPGKKRVDFAIPDGGEFDADGVADGVITDPGAIGFRALNSAPTGVPTAVLANGSEDMSCLVSAASLLAGFAHADGDTLAVANLTADHASVSDNGNGTWTLTPASNYNGQVSLSYDVIVGKGGNLAATQGFSLLAVDDLAVLGSADVTVQETNAPLIVNGVLSISDIDSSAGFVAQPGSGGKYGVFALGADGAWSYKANLAYDYLNVGESVKDSFQVKASDGTTSSVSVAIAGTADTTSVHLGDAPVSQSGTGGQWAQAWTQSGYSILHKADHTNGAEAWSVVKLSGVSSQLLTGGDIYAGDLGVSGQSVVTSTVKQEIDGKEALRVNLPTQADSVTLKLSNLFKNDDGSAMSESGLLRLLDSTGQVVAEQAFFADAASGAKTVTLAAAAGFTSLELIAGAYSSPGAFSYGGYSTAAGTFGGAVATDSAGKFHGSDFLVDSMDFVISLVGVA